MPIKMVDISGKSVTRREAVAEGGVFLRPEVIKLIARKKIPKGDVLGASRIAGILAAKKTSELIPLCHPNLIPGFPFSRKETGFSPPSWVINQGEFGLRSSKTGTEMVLDEFGSH